MYSALVVRGWRAQVNFALAWHACSHAPQCTVTCLKRASVAIGPNTCTHGFRKKGEVELIKYARSCDQKSIGTI